MLPAPPLLAAALLLVVPAATALAQDDAPPQEAAEQEHPLTGAQARLVLAHGLVEDLLEQYALEAQPWDGNIRRPPADALPRWTVPVADEAARAVGALAWLHPDGADPMALAQARAALAAVYDNVAWDGLATERALVSLSAALGALARSAGVAPLDPQQAARPPVPAAAGEGSEGSEPLQGVEVPP